MLPSQWAAQYRILTPPTAEAGPWRNERTPYLEGIMDALCEPGVSEITILKSTQIGGSEALRNMIAWVIDNDPSPILLVLPDEKSAKSVIAQRIRPLFQSCPQLAQHLTGRAWDSTQYRIKTLGASVDVGWSGSAQSLASKEIRFLFLDEEDKYASQAGDEADAISLAKERTRTYLHRARVVHLSTPTTRTGNIWRAWSDAGDKRRYYMPCPFCGRYQHFTFPQLRWPRAEATIENKAAIADDILINRRAWYECQHCQGRIEDKHKNAMLLAGLWVSEGQTVSIGGKIEGERPRSKRIGFALNCFYSPWITFSEIAYRFVMTTGDILAALNFRNSWLAEPFENIVVKPKPSVIRDKAMTAPPEGIVPAWATALIVSVDVQKDCFYYVFRAWGYGWRSQLVRLGMCRTFEEVYGLLGLQFRTTDGRSVSATVQVIDTGGNRTKDVYDYCLKDLLRIIPIKGASAKMHRPWFISKQPNDLPLRMIDTEFYKDYLNRLIEDADKTLWLPYAGVPEEYCLQMASEQKILDTKSQKLMWVPVHAGAPNHFLDCENYNLAGADMGNVGHLQPPAPPVQQQPQQRQSNWVGGGGGSWL